MEHKVQGCDSVTVSVFLKNATPQEEEFIGNAIHSVVEKAFLGREYRISSTRSGKEWLKKYCKENKRHEWNLGGIMKDVIEIEPLILSAEKEASK